MNVPLPTACHENGLRLRHEFAPCEEGLDVATDTTFNWMDVPIVGFSMMKCLIVVGSSCQIVRDNL